MVQLALCCRAPSSKRVCEPDTALAVDGQIIGTLDFNGWVMTFEGAAEESAINFFHLVSQMFSQRLDEEYQRGLNERK